VSFLRIVVVVLAVIQGSWMAFDGSRALIVGDYVTPSSGPHAGELGLWHRGVKAIGIPPRSTAMKVIFVVYGVAWLVLAFAFALREPWARPSLLAIALASLWYLPVGTVCSALVVVALLILG
jgi:hypothetical protein